MTLPRGLPAAHAEGTARNGVLAPLSLGVHTGTHVDAALHFLASGADVGSLDPKVGLGWPRVAAISNAVSVGRANLEPLEPQTRGAPAAEDAQLAAPLALAPLGC